MTQSGYYNDYKGRVNGFDTTAPDLRYKRALRLKKNKAETAKPAAASRTFFSAVQTMGYRVSEAQSKLSEIKAVNEQLEQEYAALGNLSRIEKRATDKLGMVMPEKVLTYQPSKATVDAQKKEADKATAGGRG